MKKRILQCSMVIVVLLTACEGGATPEPTSTLPAIGIVTSAPTLVPTDIRAEADSVTQVDPSAILFEQDFETEGFIGMDIPSGDWTINTDEMGNHSFCNKPEEGYSVLTFGKTWWKDYALEVRVEALEHKQEPAIILFARYNPENAAGYYGGLSFDDGYFDLAYYPPYESFTQGNIRIVNDLVVMRLEVFGNTIRYFLKNLRYGVGSDTQSSQGQAKIVVYPNLKVCIDNIRIWALTPDGQIGQVPAQEQIQLSDFEVVTDQAVVGDGGNSWGGHQSRIVRTRDGIFTAFTVSGFDDLNREWRLARRQEDGTWLIIAQGESGKDPVNLLASPDGTLHVIGWPKAFGTMWSGKPEGNLITMTRETIPGVVHGNWPYSSAGIDAEGNLCVLSSDGASPGVFQWACYLPKEGRWVSHNTPTDIRFCYTYVFPDPKGGLSLVSTRDVGWEVLGYTQPPGAFDAVFNAVGYWITENITRNPLSRVFVMEEEPTIEYPNVSLNAQQDAYQDNTGNMHILYWLQGASNRGEFTSRHAILSPTGEILDDVPLPEDIGGFARIFQDTKGNFYLLGSAGIIYPAGKDGLTLETPFEFDLKGHNVDYSGFGISVPRTGTPISDTLDVVFPSNGGKEWVYFQLTLPETDE